MVRSLTNAFEKPEGFLTLRETCWDGPMSCVKGAWRYLGETRRFMPRPEGARAIVIKLSLAMFVKGS